MKKILLTGFVPFLNHTTNPSQVIAKKLNGFKNTDFEIISEILPVVYDELDELIPHLILKHSPDLIISLGLASDREIITPERIAKNIMHGSSPDNTGTIKNLQKILDENIEYLETTLPIDKIIAQVTKKNIICEASDDAGSYICNKTMFLFLNTIREKQLNIKAGFIHIPGHLKIDVLQDSIMQMLIVINSLT